ncbi:hypothetical protein AB4Y30_06595 [Ornithinibacillus sp. 4-3]|uniref:YtxH domain-containing protein n=1 Tax=Ornithinibacillus sp. 4-3 TaxID=3231488 RepID=A0AB39HU96_9BACI
MKKSIIAFGAGTAGLVGLLLTKQENRKKVRKTYHMIVNKIRGIQEYPTVVQAGIPDQVDREDIAQLENAKMVSEGSQYGVNYYNRQVQEEKAEKMQTQ